MKTYHICYHTDEDGKASGAIIYEYLKRLYGKKNIRCNFYKVDYTMSIAECISDNINDGDEVYFVDYSFSSDDNFNYLNHLISKGIKVVWIDHHKTSKELIESNRLYTGNEEHLINTKYCGAYLCYIYAYAKLNNLDSMIHDITEDNIDEITKNIEIPLYIKYVDSWDSWKHNMENTIDFHYGIESIKHDVKNTFSVILNFNGVILKQLFTDDMKDLNKSMTKFINKIIARGEAIRIHAEIENDYICNQYGFEMYIHDHIQNRIYKCFAVNHRGNSMMFGDRVDEYDILIPFTYNGNQYVYSLYTSKDDIDCSRIAKIIGNIDSLGGGGHSKAAGAQTYDLLITENCTVHIAKKIFRKNKFAIFSVR